jgi:hypothetical protein
MAQLVSAKGNDILAWRASGDFTATYRQIILDHMEYCRFEEATATLNGAIDRLEELIVANDAFRVRCQQLLDETGSGDDGDRLQGMTTLFFSDLYEHHATYRSAPAFYQLSTQYLHALGGSIAGSGFRRLEASPRELPRLALIAVGPAGRQEFSPFCPLQMLLVHDPADATDLLLIDRFAAMLREGFGACGLRLDNLVSPHLPFWRGSLPDWEHRLETSLESGTSAELVELLRLTDQTLLYGDAELAEQFRTTSHEMLSGSHAAVANIVSRVVALSNGIGIMGGLRFERSGPFKGRFALLEHGLQPLSASLAVLGMLKRLESVATPRRVRELLWRRELNVDMSERLLSAWHTLHEMRLQREREIHPAWDNALPLHVDVDSMAVPEQEAFREALEAVGTIQRHIGLTFTGMAE